MHIESMWVDPLHRNSGIARALIERIEYEAGKLDEKEIRLWVFVGNTVARNCYLKKGYEAVGCQDIKITDGSVIKEEEFRKALR